MPVLGSNPAATPSSTPFLGLATGLGFNSLTGATGESGRESEGPAAPTNNWPTSSKAITAVLGRLLLPVIGIPICSVIAFETRDILLFTNDQFLAVVRDTLNAQDPAWNLD